MIRRLLKALAISILTLVVVATLAFLVWNREPAEATPIVGLAHSAESFIGSPHTPNPIVFQIEAHPYMAAQGRNSMHADGYSSDVHNSPAPLGLNPMIRTRKGTKLPGGQCATLTFSSEGNLVALCAAVSGFRIYLMEPRTLELLALIKLPTRPSTYAAIRDRDRRRIMEDSSGAYFYLDEKDRLVMADSRQTVRRIGHRQLSSGEWEFYDNGAWDLSSTVPHDCPRPTKLSPAGECDPITAVMPDYSGLLWWVTRNGRVGTLNFDSGETQQLQLKGEEIQNGFSVASDGVFVVSDHAMYRFEADANGEPQVGWRQPYDRGSNRKTGTINQGSGTTPTLLGTEYVTITDNADGRINLIVYRRKQNIQTERTVCTVPLFQNNHSVTDNSMIAFNRSILIENNAGYTHSRAQSDWINAGGGVTRVDIRDDESGCDVIWESSEKAPSSVPKFSAHNGLAYVYTFEQQPEGAIAWYLTALDYVTGQTQFKILTGAGPNFDNNWAPITLAPDGTAYVGTSVGIVAIWDES